LFAIADSFSVDTEVSRKAGQAQTHNALGHSRHCLVHPVSALVILSIVSNAANVEHILAFAILHREGNFVVIKSHVVINVARTSILKAELPALLRLI
jgi:hypothetical protein